MKNRLRELVDRSLPELCSGLESPVSLKDFRYDIEIPKIKAHGDFSVNAAFLLAKSIKKNPFEIAERFHKILETKVVKDNQLKSLIKTIKVEKPGFINFKFTEDAFSRELTGIFKADQKYGLSEAGGGKKVVIEFVSANPTGPLTIAHGRQAAIGDTLARILEAVGYQVHREFYLNDAGKQVELYRQSVAARLNQLEGKEVPIPEEGYHGEYVRDSAKAFKTKNQKLKPEDFSNPKSAVYQAVIDERLENIKEDLTKMDVRFDEYYSEKSLYDKKLVDKALDTLKSKGYLYEADGALWFRSTDFGDDKDRVLRKQTGELTYLAPDIAYHQEKFRRGFDHLINLLGPDHHGYIGRIKAACEALGHDPKQLQILIVQLVTLYRNGEQVRMSKRAGEYVTLRDLIDEVGPDATRFFFLMRKVESHLDFDLELAKKKSDENPVYYLQYAHARISSILGFANQKIDEKADLSLIREEEALDLIRKMLEYPDVLKQAAHYLEPYRVVDYLRDLATVFHKFYSLHRVVSDDEPLTKARLFLTDTVRRVLRNGLQILGVSAPQKM